MGQGELLWGRRHGNTTGRGSRGGGREASADGGADGTLGTGHSTGSEKWGGSRKGEVCREDVLKMEECAACAMGRTTSPKRHVQVLTPPVNAALFGNRVFEDAIKLSGGHARLGWP